MAFSSSCTIASLHRDLMTKSNLLEINYKPLPYLHQTAHLSGFSIAGGHACGARQTMLFWLNPRRLGSANIYLSIGERRRRRKKKMTESPTQMDADKMPSPTTMFLQTTWVTLAEVLEVTYFRSLARPLWFSIWIPNFRGLTLIKRLLCPWLLSNCRWKIYWSSYSH